ncbi:DUF3267 domain-containing protein [Clostridium estertheticum]|uniref:DUF3267 domain-containing protein n=1 Tax=Clostridium estertheticum TaxID=238834 RepID=UPI001C0B0FCD|nr:DUF3267 domain-containing protein [Clostridium estertheticum]MBU3198433.1 DUF3267 domain-containing protein [Clostridium estertheticum]WAG65113.1 DUF3267 domain-containing protein [Clostridium estertheticum]
MSFKITWKTHVICFLISAIIAMVLRDSASVLVENFIMQDFILYPTKFIYINFYIAILLLLVPIIAIHEAIHGISFIVFGGKVKYGFKGIYAYTMEVSAKPIQRVKFLIVLLSPVTIISLLSLLLPHWISGMVYFLNLLGSSGDLYMASLLIRLKSESGIIDRKYGFDVVVLDID